MADLVTVEGIHKRFAARRDALGRPSRWVDAVKGVSLSIARGETVALVGESGSGKSTTGRLILRLERPDSGRVCFEGIDISSLSRRDLRRWRAKAQMIFQDPYASLDPLATVGFAVGEPLTIHEGTRGRDLRERVESLFDRVGLAPDAMPRKPYEFSGGQLQRVAIARALATSPSFIVCDEPVAALDMSIRSGIINLLRDLQQERGISYLFISHDLSLVRAIADRVLVMFQGDIVEQGTVVEVFQTPQQPYTKKLLSAVPVPNPRLRLRTA